LDTPTALAKDVAEVNSVASAHDPLLITVVVESVVFSLKERHQDPTINSLRVVVVLHSLTLRFAQRGIIFEIDGFPVDQPRIAVEPFGIWCIGDPTPLNACALTWSW
jgi:hypothetical protein